MTERYHSLQILRAIAAWMVFYYHYMMLFHRFEYETILGYAFTQYGEFGVDIFFVLSGFVMYFSAKPDKASSSKFFADRFFRVVPAYWFFTFTVILCIYIFPIGFFYTDYTIGSLVKSLLFIPHDNPSGWMPAPLLTVGWTLNFEMTFYTILTLCLAVFHQHARFVAFAVIALLPLIYPADLIFSEVLGSNLLFEFLAGFSVAFIVSNKFFKPFLKYRFTLAIITGTIGLILWKNYYLHDALRVLAATFIILSAVLINNYINAQNLIIKHLIKLGDHSYSTYLIHVIVLGIFYHFFQAPQNLSHEIIILSAMTFVLIFASKLSYRFVEQNKSVITLKAAILRKIANNSLR